MDWTALVGGQRIAAGLQPFAGRVSLRPYWLSVPRLMRWIAEATGEVRGMRGCPSFTTPSSAQSCILMYWSPARHRMSHYGVGSTY
jgi:hypothetical protein